MFRQLTGSRPYKKPHGAMRSCMGHALTESRSGLIVQGAGPGRTAMPNGALPLT